ncbi:MAG: type II toxin-antitoxin system YoeB family toxin, partial [Methylophaga sp.]|nr:type II toxin-antitoxin system YoeB family toxin [Methylophaga sp.]
DLNRCTLIPVGCAQWTLTKEMLRNDPAIGLGKPEQLKYSLSGFWSRRLSQMDRVINKFDDKYIYIFAIGGHYNHQP